MVTVSRLVDKYDGTLCRFIVDDKGNGFLISFGLPPAMHENDPDRAVHMSLETIHCIRSFGISLS